MTMTVTTTDLKRRFDRALEGLKRGTYTVEGPRKASNGFQWTVVNTKSAYSVVFDKSTGFTCECPDFAQRGGVCKHMIMVRIMYDLRHDLKQRPIADLLADEGIVETLWDTVQQMAERQVELAQPAQPQAQTDADTTPPAPPAADNGNATATPPSNGTGALAEAEAPEASTVMPWGKYKGRTFGEMVADKEGADYLVWLLNKWEPREGDDPTGAERLKSAARAVLEAAVRKAASDVMAGNAPMPTVPFGDEKGKPLSGAGACHPKWVAILAKKSLADAWSFEDAVTFEVARRLKAQMDEKRQSRRGGSGGGLSDEAARELAEAIRELAAAIREVGGGEQLEQTLFNAIRKGITQAVVYHTPFRA